MQGVRVGVAAAALVAGLGAAASAAPTTIEFWTAYSQPEQDALVGKVIPLFEKAHPDIKVTARAFEYGDLRQKLVVGAASGAGPDLARIDIIWSPELAAEGMLLPLDKLPGFAELKSQVFPGPLRTNVWKSSTYGLPLDTNTQVYLYNNSVFEQAGVPVPTTLDQWVTATRHLTQRTNDRTTRWGYALPSSNPWHTLPWIWINGGSVTDANVTQATGYLDSDATIGAVSLIKQLYDEGALSPLVAGGKAIGTWEGLESGEYAATQDGPWAVNPIRQKLPDLGERIMPAGPGGSSSVIGGENIGIFKSSAHPEAAWTFARFMLSPEAQTIMAAAGQMPVIRQGLHFPGAEDLYAAYMHQLETAKPRTVHPEWAKIGPILDKAFKDVMTDKMPAKSAFTDAARRIDTLLQDYASSN